MGDRKPDAAEASLTLSRTRLLVIGTLLVLVAIVVGVLVGRANAPAAAQTPEESSAEAGFARDMQVHHGQAVEMSLIIRERTDDPEIRLLALDIHIPMNWLSTLLAFLLDGEEVLFEIARQRANVYDAHSGEHLFASQLVPDGGFVTKVQPW